MQPGSSVDLGTPEPITPWQLRHAAAELIRDGRTVEAEALLLEGQARHPGDAQTFIDYAAIAEAAQDWPEALRRFEAVHDAFPDSWWAYLRMAVMLRQMGRFDEAERVLEQGQREIPHECGLFIEYATIPEVKQDWQQALDRFRVVNERFPDNWWAYARMGLALRNMNRLDEADRVLAEGQERIPDERALFIDYGTVAEMRGDWPEALRRFEVVNGKFPDNWWAYARMAIALRHLGRLDEAERVLERGQQHVPDERALFIDHGTIAEQREDWPEALRRFEGVSERFPDDWWSYARRAIALRHLGRLDEAERILEQGQQRFPHQRALFIDHAAIAEQREDWPEALERFEGVAGRFPDEWWSYARRAVALRHLGRLDEAERILEQGQQRFPHQRALFIDHAAIAEQREDWPEALKRFEGVQQRFPDGWWTRLRIGVALQRLGRLDEAERILDEARQLFPEERALQMEHAAIAEQREDWPEAIERFKAIYREFPDHWWPGLRIGIALRHLGRLDEADRVLDEARQRFPEEQTLQFEHAANAELRKDWPESLRRFQLFGERFPDEWIAYSRRAKALRRLDRVEEAERVLEDGQARLPDEPGLFIEHAELAESVWRWDEALRRYTVVLDRFPDNWWGHVGQARNLIETGRFTDAETLMLEMLRRFPDSQQPLIDLVYLAGRLAPAERQVSVEELDRLIAERAEAKGSDASLLDAQAQIARLQGDYQLYHDRLVALAERFPDTAGIREKIVTAQEILLGSGATEGQAAPALRQVPPAGADDASVTAILPGFESLGGGGPDNSTLHGCEFGFIQRHYKIEPLSLLRWSGVSLPDLTRALEAGFAGVGSPGSTVLRTRPSASDWAMVDTTYNICCDHTHLDHVTVPEAEAHRMMCQRMSFLSRKLIEDLEDGEKLFVYRYSGPLPAQDVLLRLAAAVNRYGSNVLLFVCRADADNPPFSIRRLHQGLMVGYMDWFALDRVGMPWNTDGWAHLCRNARSEWTAGA